MSLLSAAVAAMELCTRCSCFSRSFFLLACKFLLIVLIFLDFDLVCFSDALYFRPTYFFQNLLAIE